MYRHAVELLAPTLWIRRRRGVRFSEIRCEPFARL